MGRKLVSVPLMGHWVLQEPTTKKSEDTRTPGCLLWDTSIPQDVAHTSIPQDAEHTVIDRVPGPTKIQAPGLGRNLPKISRVYEKHSFLKCTSLY